MIPDLFAGYESVEHALGLVAEVMRERGEHFIVAAPCQMTVRKPSGGFAKIPLIGGERIRLVDTYEGKTGRILQFESDGAASYLYEIRLDKCPEMIAHFETEVLSALGRAGLDERSLSEAKREALMKEEEAHKAALDSIRMNDERFGSW